MGYIEDYFAEQPLVSNRSAQSTTLSNAQRLRLRNGAPRKRSHDYRVTHTYEALRGVPATDGSQADSNRKRHKLAAITKPRTSGPSSKVISYNPTHGITREQASLFTRERDTRKRTTRSNVDQANRMAELAHVSAAQLAPIGNID